MAPGDGEGPEIAVKLGTTYGATVMTPGPGVGTTPGAGVGIPPGKGVGLVKSQYGTWQHGLFLS